MPRPPAPRDDQRGGTEPATGPGQAALTLIQSVDPTAPIPDEPAEPQEKVMLQALAKIPPDVVDDRTS